MARGKTIYFTGAEELASLILQKIHAREFYLRFRGQPCLYAFRHSPGKGKASSSISWGVRPKGEKLKAIGRITEMSLDEAVAKVEEILEARERVAQAQAEAVTDVLPLPAQEPEPEKPTIDVESLGAEIREIVEDVFSRFGPHLRQYIDLKIEDQTNRLASIVEDSIRKVIG